jgi:hypothetical protein
MPIQAIATMVLTKLNVIMNVARLRPSELPWDSSLLFQPTPHSSSPCHRAQSAPDIFMPRVYKLDRPV